MIIPQEGEILKCHIPGDLFEVKKMGNQSVILHWMDGMPRS